MIAYRSNYDNIFILDADTTSRLLPAHVAVIWRLIRCS